MTCPEIAPVVSIETSNTFVAADVVVIRFEPVNETVSPRLTVCVVPVSPEKLHEDASVAHEGTPAEIVNTCPFVP